MNLEFTMPCSHEPGTVFSLLEQAWAPLWNPTLEENIRQFDRDVAEHPDTVGACTFITCLDSTPIGMASYNPTGRPEQAEIGWNCVLPQYQRRGFGKKQIQEIVRILRGKGIRKVWVTTADEDFFVPAQRTYESCGFAEVRRTEDNNIEYELELE